MRYEPGMTSLQVVAKKAVLRFVRETPHGFRNQRW
jgi:hypothetical protein